MKLVIEGDRLNGGLFVPPSKSMSHRAVIAAALAEGTSVLEGVLSSVDLTATIEGLKSLGVDITRTEQVVVKGGLKGKEGIIDCHESGSTIRFLIPISLLTCESYTFVGRGKLVERPLAVYSDLFREKGVDCQYNGRLPFVCRGPISSGVYSVPGDISSQFITGLLYTLPLLEGDSILQITESFESKPYVDLTVEMLRQFGIAVEELEQGYAVKGNQKYVPCHMRVEGDFSQAAFWIVAGVISGNIELRHLNLNSKQGDKAILDIVKTMGGDISIHNDFIAIKQSKTRGMVIDASQIPDLVPILAVLASVSDGETRIINAERVRIKESDRLLAISTELRKMGAQIVEQPDGLIITGVSHLHGAEVDAWNDHRIAMALTVASLKAQGRVTLTGAESVTKSYPHFFEDFRTLGGIAHE